MTDSTDPLSEDDYDALVRAMPWKGDEIVKNSSYIQSHSIIDGQLMGIQKRQELIDQCSITF